MIVLTTTYNCENFIEKCLLSIMSQRFKDFKCYVTDDMSTDNTVKIIKEAIKNDSRFILIENHEKFYQPGNYEQVIRYKDVEGDEVCVEVDGDDWLPNSNVFTKINDIYQDENVWMTSGSFKYHDGRPGFANPPSKFTDIRRQTFTLSHLRTWRAWLWKKILPEDLKDDTGKFWSVAGDLAFMFPMLEMSGEEHYRFLTDINYIYNESNPINDHKVNLGKVMTIVSKIRNKREYQKI